MIYPYPLSVLWSDIDLPETIQATQSMYGGCCADEETNLLRIGGVYLLPLVYWSDGKWYITGDLDVLFEVDDKGRVWSHSQFDGFKQFDGKDASVLSQAVINLTSDENFSAAVTSFGYIARNWGVLAEVTVLSETKTAISVGQWGYDCYNYVLNVDNLLSIAQNDWYKWKPENGEEITAISYSALDVFELGGQYLMMLDPSEDGPYIDSTMVAKINKDGTITAVYSPDYANIFEEYNGYTVEQMKEEAERAKAWHESHVK